MFIYIIPTFYFAKIIGALSWYFWNFFLRLKYQKNMAPKKSKVKKRVAQPAKSIIERTICAHPMLKRVQKEVRELKKKSAKKHKK